MAVTDGQTGVSDKVGETVGAAEGALGCVVIEALVGPVDGGLQGEGRGGASLVLQRQRDRGGSDGWLHGPGNHMNNDGVHASAAAPA